MTTLSRLTGKVFAGNADLENLGVFGSALSGSPTNPTGTDTEAQIQADTAYEEGWTEAVVTSKNFPPIEEVNGVLRTISYQNCYILQEGVPSYDIDTNYSATSIVKSISGNTLTFYLSQKNDNKGNSLTDPTSWRPAIFAGTGAIGAPQFTLNFTDPLPDNCIELQGQAVSQTTYNNLYAIYGSTYNTGDEATGYFRLPDFSNKTIYGALSAGYIDAGLPDLGLSADYSGIHSHNNSVTTQPNHTHNGGSLTVSGKFRTSFGGSTASGVFSGTSVSGYGETGSGTDSVVSMNTNGKWSGSTTGSGSHTHTVTIENSVSHTHSIVSSNALVGSANTVLVDGVKVRVYTRYQ